MKRLPLIFSLLMFSCAAPKQMVTTVDVSKYQQPYRIFTVGEWNPNFVILTLTDAKETYFSVKATKDPQRKKGDIYTP